MRLRTKFALTAVGGIVVLSVALQLTTIGLFSRQIHSLSESLFKEKLNRLVAFAYEQDELFYEGIIRDVRDGQRRTIAKLHVDYRNNKDTSTYAFIIDAAGRIITHPAESRWRGAFSYPWFKGDQFFSLQTTALMRSKMEGTLWFRAKDGKRQWCVFKFYEPWGWYFCQATDTETLNRAAIKAAVAGILISVLAIVLCVVTIVFLFNNFTKPIQMVIDRLEEVSGEGALPRPIALRGKGDDEADKLAKAFNKMAEDLQKATVSRDYLNTILSASPLGMALTDEKGNNLYSNKAFLQILGLTENLAQDQGWVRYLHPDDNERVLSEWSTALKERTGYDFEQRFLRGPEAVWTRMVGAPMFDDGKLTGYVFTIEDITEQKILTSTVRQSEKMAAVGQLAGGIAHDLNNGLTPVMGYLDMLLTDAGPDSPSRVLLDEAKQSTQRCIDVVKKLLNFSRPASQAKTDLSVPAMLAEFERLAHTLLPPSITLKIKCEPGTRPIYGNDGDLINVLMNLAVNARDAMAGKGSLTVEARNAVVSKDKGRKINDGVIITVTDTGKGIPPEVLPRIFEPFFTTKPKGQGTGLGLSMVYNTLKDHQATIDVASVPGKGTTFTLYFPDPKDVARDYVQSVTSPGVSVPMIKGSGLVLFVDDEESLRNMGRVFLERMGYDVVLAKDGEEALEIFQQRRKDITVTVLDMTMPKLTGLETMKRMHQIDPRAKVILASGFTTEGTAEELVRAGALAFLPKPYMIGPLADTLRKALGKK